MLPFMEATFHSISPSSKTLSIDEREGAKVVTMLRDVKWRYNLHNRSLTIYRSTSHASVEGRRMLRGKAYVLGHLRCKEITRGR